MNRNESGEVNVLLIVVVLISLIAAGFAAAFIWAFSERDNYKNNSDAIVATAVTEAKVEQEQIDKTWYAEEEKKPNLDFAGPADFGSITFKYPKTWASYNSDSTATKYSIYFNPKMVLSTSNTSATYALHLNIENKTYESVLKSFESAASRGEVTITPINVGPEGQFNGMRIDGLLEKSINGSIAVFKIRDKSFTLRTDSDSFLNDFNNTILATLQFQP